MLVTRIIGVLVYDADLIETHYIILVIEVVAVLVEVVVVVVAGANVVVDARYLSVVVDVFVVVAVDKGFLNVLILFKDFINEPQPPSPESRLLEVFLVLSHTRKNQPDPQSFSQLSNHVFSPRYMFLLEVRISRSFFLSSS